MSAIQWRPFVLALAVPMAWATLALCQEPLPDRAGGKGAERIRVIVRGDDFGQTHSSNLALVQAFTDGIMTSASVIVTGPWFAETAALIREHPEWTVGIHLTLTSHMDRLRWRPIAPAEKVPTLLAPDGYMVAHFWRDVPGIGAKAELAAQELPALAEIETEMRAQIEFARNLGIRIDYLDCHMWLACLQPIRAIMEQLSRELCVPLGSLGMVGEKWGPEEYAPSGLSREGVKVELMQWLRSLTPGLWTYVDHPSAGYDEVAATDSEWGKIWAEHQVGVLMAWTDPEIKALIDELDIDLVSYKELWDYQRCEARPD